VSKFTKGPWRYQGEVTREINQPNSVSFEVYTSTGNYGHPATCEREEDARLISASPDMYSAIKELLDVPGIVDCMPVAIWDALNDSIEKAEGKE
jgi:hypothetical protein